jgi:diguanylate cyclase (GGDEF)-like protein/PAS domain S-box-containing protein
MWVFDRDSLRFLAVNEAAVRQYGYSEREFLRMTIAHIRPEEDIPALMRHVASRESGLQLAESWRHRKKDGTVIDVEITSHDLDFQGIDAMLVSSIDVTERKRAQELAKQAEENYRGIFDNAIIGIFQATPQGRPISVNRAMARIHGYESPHELLAEITDVAAQLFVDPKRMTDLHTAAREDGVIRGAEVEVFRKDHSRRWIAMNLRTVQDAAGNISHLEGTVEDITERKAAEAQARFLAYYDALTGLPNRNLFKDRLENALATARQRDERVAVLFLDIDHFKVVNDSLGQSIGDRMLKEVARRIKHSLREDETVARAGSDEFLILLRAVHDAAEVSGRASRICNAIQETWTIDSRSFNMTSSVGTSIFPDDNINPEALIKYADQAMHRAKEDGRNNFRFFTEDLNAEAMERLSMEGDLREAIERNEFFVAYQPLIRVLTGEIVGVEALLRWPHPRLGLVPPDRFIPVAENSGLILPIGEWVLRAACAEVIKWRAAGLAVVPVAVNVSAVQFRHNGFCALIREVLAGTGLDPESLELELTESLLLSNADVTLPVLEELREIGVRLSIDDFGTGYSSLSYLKKLHANKLKIDRSFVQGLADNSSDAAIATAIISMAKSLNVTVVAEGVETQEQLTFLRDHQCDEVQGFYFCQPVSSSEIVRKLRRNSSRAEESNGNGLLAILHSFQSGK